MKFIFKMLFLVGMILVGKFLKEDATSEISKKGNSATEDTYSLNIQETSPRAQQTNTLVVPTAKNQNSEETFTYSFN
ncbi:hypothetical protein [Rufibacter hautae]|uniref:Uncharacterized protein n=1 Tax=Rufibacter hautae TaxID=2595005 RepID=A0A5B6TJX4_9BACT|nr:hypothetical protein [Rufibacter hautae]KAA3440731.1 hypothetical protein FOA19_08805 [Rufibacter hautae]